MHDVKRDSLFEVKDSKKKHAQKKSQPQETSHENASHSHDEKLASKYEGYEHRHVHEDDEEHEHEDEHFHEHEHEDEDYHGHEHNHDEEEYHEHDHDEHHHHHPKKLFHDRAFEHIHEHGHQFSHSHDHVHHRDETSVAHKWFKDPVRDWFALVVMGILIAVNMMGLARDNLAKGLLVMAAVLGLFPLIKNAVIRGILEKRFVPELGVSLIFIVIMFYGKLLYAAIGVFLILLGSFLRLNFSWNKK